MIRKAGWPARVLAGALVAVVLLVVAYVVVRHHAPYLFTQSTIFQFYMRKASGVEVGTPVWVLGLDAGKVTRMEPEEVRATHIGGTVQEGKVLAVKVTCRVYTPFHRLLRKGSTVDILLLSVLGRPRVHVIPAPPGMPRAPQRDVLGQTIIRGFEGTAEEFLDRAQKVNEKAETLGVFLETLDQSLKDMEDRYKTRPNTLYSLLQEGPDRERLQETSQAMEKKSKELKEILDAIEADQEALGPNPLGSTETDFEEAGRLLEETRVIGREAGERWKQFFRDFDAFTRTARAAVDGSKAFQEDLLVFLDAKDRYVPDILRLWYSIERDLVVDMVRRLKTSVLEQPGMEVERQWIRRGRLRDKKGFDVPKGR